MPHRSMVLLSAALLGLATAGGVRAADGPTGTTPAADSGATVNPHAARVDADQSGIGPHGGPHLFGKRRDELFGVR